MSRQATPREVLEDVSGNVTLLCPPIRKTHYRSKSEAVRTLREYHLSYVAGCLEFSEFSSLSKYFIPEYRVDNTTTATSLSSNTGRVWHLTMSTAFYSYFATLSSSSLNKCIFYINLPLSNNNAYYWSSAVIPEFCTSQPPRHSVGMPLDQSQKDVQLHLPETVK